MIPVTFPGCNILIGKDQPQYQPLPAMALDGPEGERIICFELTDEELETLKTTKRLYYSQWTFGQHFHPMKITTNLEDGIFLTHLEG
jgi:hypothetical protein